MVKLFPCYRLLWVPDICPKCFNLHSTHHKSNCQTLFLCFQKQNNWKTMTGQKFRLTPESSDAQALGATKTPHQKVACGRGSASASGQHPNFMWMSSSLEKNFIRSLSVFRLCCGETNVNYACRVQNTTGCRSCRYSPIKFSARVHGDFPSFSNHQFKSAANGFSEEQVRRFDEQRCFGRTDMRVTPFSRHFSVYKGAINLGLMFLSQSAWDLAAFNWIKDDGQEIMDTVASWCSGR